MSFEEEGRAGYGRKCNRTYHNHYGSKASKDTFSNGETPSYG